MHDDEVDVDEELVRSLLRAQFPAGAELPLSHLTHSGTDHHIWRIGDDLQARLPKHGPSAGQARIEATLLPQLAPHLPVEVPVPVAHGEPGFGYPFDWAVYRWLQGATPDDASPALARQVAEFLLALQGIDAAGAPSARVRGAPLARADDAFFRSSLGQLEGEYDSPRLRAIFDRALAAPDWHGEPVWLHGDVLAGNLLVRDGRLAAVIDWGLACAGDPASDLIIGWSLLAPVRSGFQEAVGLEEATWERARGWALWQAVNALPYYRDTNPPMADHARTVLGNLLLERGMND